MNSQNSLLPVLALIGLACVGLGIYSVTKKAEPLQIQPTQSTSTSESANTGQPQKRVPPPQPKVTSPDLRGKYGIVNHAIFNETTHVVFTTPEQFFNETGLTSFAGVKTDSFSQLPRNSIFVDGTPLAQRDYEMLENSR